MPMRLRAPGVFALAFLLVALQGTGGGLLVAAFIAAAAMVVVEGVIWAWRDFARDRR